MSGSVGGVDSAIPLSAGRIGQGGGGNTLAADPTKFVDMLGGMARLQLLRNQNELFPGQQQLQQQEIQRGGQEIQRGGLANEQLQQQLTAYKNKQVAAGMMPLFLKGDSATLADATNALGWLQAFGSDTTGMTAALKASGATGGKPLLDVVRAGIVQAFPDLGVPKIEYQQVGDAAVPVNTNLYAGPLGPMGPSLSMGLSPGQKAGQIPALGGTAAQPQEGEVAVGDIYNREGTRRPSGAAAPGGTGAGGTSPAASPQMTPMPPDLGPAGFRPTRAPLGTTEGATSSQETYGRYQKFAETNPSSEQNIRNAAEAYRYIQGGAATPLSANASRWMVAAGLDPKALNLADPAQAQIAAKSATLALFSQMSGVQNPALAEYGMMQKASPDLDLEPGALKAIMAQSLAKMNMQNDLFKEMSAYRRAHNNSMAGFDPGEFLNTATAKMPQYQEEARKSLPLLKGETPDLPPGAKQIGTKGGQPVYQLPDGSRIMVHP